MSSNQQQPPPPGSGDGSFAHDGPGVQIRAARERLGLTLDDLVARTRLPRATVEAIERDDFELLDEPVFVRGYYRKCARVLGLDERSLLAAYEARVTPHAPAPLTKPLLAGGDELIKPRRGFGRLWWWLGLVLVLVLLVGWLLHRLAPEFRPMVRQTLIGSSATGERALPAEPVQIAPSPTVGSPVSSPTPPPATTASGAAPAEDGPASVASARDGVPASVASSGGAEPPPQATAVAGNRLVLQFTQTSWVHIEDANGRLLLSGLMQAGQQRVLEGRPPYSVFLGNAPGVQVTYADRPVNVAGQTRANSTARFSVP